MTSSSGAYRAIEIVLGIIALVAGLLALFFPTAVVVTLVVFFGIALLVIGVLRIASAVASSSMYGSTRGTNAIIGVIALVIGVLILFFPVFATEVIVILIGFAILIWGLGRLVVGGAARNLSMGLRALIVIVGILVAIFGVMIILFPVVGVFTYAFFVALALILIGIDSIASGAIGIPLT
ncbi:MAG: HdeD family acid-resistance protein [Candidatus Bathyarchaeia archaeon]|jgi:uncharacterized membrane protein HdeD (DUF308 family)